MVLDKESVRHFVFGDYKYKIKETKKGAKEVIKEEKPKNEQEISNMLEKLKKDKDIECMSYSGAHCQNVRNYISEAGFEKSSGNSNDKTVSNMDGDEMYGWMTNDECVTMEGRGTVYKIYDTDGHYRFKIKKEKKHQGYIQYSIIE